MHAELQLDNQICFRLYTAARLVTQAYTPMLTALGITYPQYLVLMVLWEKDEQPVNDIAHRLLLETNTVTPLLQRMEKLGLVSRKKGDVNGPAAEPIFEYLKTQAPTEEYNGLKAKAAKTLFKAISKSVEKDSDIKWNFTKFLISKDGETIKRYAPTTEPKDFEKDVEAMLA